MTESTLDYMRRIERDAHERHYAALAVVTLKSLGVHATAHAVDTLVSVMKSAIAYSQSNEPQP